MPEKNFLLSSLDMKWLWSEAPVWQSLLAFVGKFALEK